MAQIPTRERIKTDETQLRPQRRPEWIRVRAPMGESYDHVRTLIHSKTLHTVCEEAMCPNIGECFNAGTATFLLLGDICTRSCKFCDVKRGKPLPLDLEEPQRIAEAVKAMGLKHAVITSVNRDDCKDGGASIFAATIRRIRELQPGCTVEALIPDFKGEIDALKIVMDARPDILNHNVETVPRLFKQVQPQDRFEWAKATLTNAKKLQPNAVTKSGIMVGLGETFTEVQEVMAEIHSWNVDILTIGQYLQPSKAHLPVERYYTLEEFQALKEYGLQLGFQWVESAPLVRSSYHAAAQVQQVRPENH